MEDTADTTKQRAILLADAERFIDIAYKDGLQRAGYAVAVANDGEEVLEIIKSEPPDVLLLELMLPKLSGFEVLQKMHRDKLKGIPVLVLTNLSQESDQAEARSYGALDVLVKPETSLQDLLVRLDKLFHAQDETPADS